MDYASVIHSSTRSSFHYPIELREEIGQKTSRSHKEVDTSVLSYAKTARLSDEKINVVDHNLSINRRQRNGAHEDLYSKLPDAEEFEPVTESQAKQVLVKIHHEMHEFKSLFNHSTQAIDDSSGRFTNLNGTSFRYLVYLIQDLFFDTYQEAIKNYAETNEILSKCFRAQMQASAEKEQQRLEQFNEQRAKAYKSGAVFITVDWISAAFLLGYGISTVMTGGLSAIPVAACFGATGLAAGIKAWFEGDALEQRASGNNKQAEESGRIAQIAGVIEFAGLFLTLGVGLAARTAAKNAAIIERIGAEINLPLQNESAITPLEIAITAQRAAQAEGLSIELGIFETLDPPLWETFSGLTPAVAEAVASQWQAMQYMRNLSFALQSFNIAADGLLKAYTAQCEGIIQTLSQEAGALKRFAQTVTHQLIKESLENLQLNAKRLIELLKASQLWLTKHAETIRLASDSIAINA